MTSLLQKNNKLQLLEEIKATFVECEFNSRWTLIEGYHKVGELITINEVSDLTQVAEYVGRSKRTVQRCKQFFVKYPDLSVFPVGKNISWNQIVTKYLPEEVKEPTPTMLECPYCHKTWEK